MDENANSAMESENPANEESIDAAFEAYLNRQANPEQSDAEQPESSEEADDGQSEQEEEPAEEAQEEQRYKVKINGEEREVPVSELVKGYQLESDYRIKTSQLAEQARKYEAEISQATQAREQYSQVLQQYAAQLQQTQPQAPDPALIQSDPVAFLQQQTAYQAWQQQMQRVQYEHQALQEQQRQHVEATAREALVREQQALFKAIPDFADETKAKALKSDISAFLQKTGFSPDEIGGVADHRALVLAHKAMLYDQLIAKQSSAVEKAKAAPPKAPQRPGAGKLSPTDGRTRAMQNLKQTGSIDAAANAFAQFLSAH